jgi:hypothetical protein
VASSSSPPVSSYAPPTALEDLHILDFLELAGSQAKAGAALAMHQSTVCRSVQLMQLQFRLVPRQGSSVCRHGHNTCLQHLRLAYREHRLMEGLLRIGTDVLHQRLLQGLAGIQQVPARCRQAEHWAELVRHGLLDGALLSSFCMERRLLSGQLPHWDGLVVLPLGQLRLQLVATAATSRRVLLPPQSGCPPAASGRCGTGLRGGAAASGLPGGRGLDQARPRPAVGSADQPRTCGAELVGAPWPAAPG